jgi:Ser/Thr protein kinase RdoA (MazF antagonist)
MIVCVPDQPLTAGSGANLGAITQRGDTVLRPLGPHSPAIHALLRHLREDGFTGAPEVVGIEDGQEVLRFIDGEVPVPPTPPGGGWPVVSAARLSSVGQLLSVFHAASSRFSVPPGATWQGGAPAPFDGDLIAHNDPVVGNIVFCGERAIALLDFDYAGPSDPIWDVAIACQHWVPLADPADFVDGGGVDNWNAKQRLAAFRDGYGLRADRLSHLFDAVETYLKRGLFGVQERVEAGEPAFVSYWQAGLGERLSRASSWVRVHRSSLTD